MTEIEGGISGIQGEDATRDLKGRGTIPVPERMQAPENQSRLRYNPKYFFWLLVAGIFLAEVIAMLIIRAVSPGSVLFEILLDALILTAFVVPVAFFLSFRPLTAEIKRSHQAEADLQAAHDELELRVAERSRELQQALDLSHQRRREVEALLQAARTILEQREFPVAARAIFDSCKALIGATAGYVALEEGDTNVPLFLDPGENNCVVDPNLPMPIRGLRALAYERKRTVFENNFQGSDWVQFLPGGHAELQNVLFSPLIIRGSVVGLIGLANKPGDFTQDDARLATAFGEIAAIALLNSQAEQELRLAHDDLEVRVLERTRELAQANQLLQLEIKERRLAEDNLQKSYAELLNLNAASQALNLTLDLDTVIDTLMDYMDKLVPNDGGSVILREAETQLTVRARRSKQVSDRPGKSFDLYSYPYIRQLMDQQKSVLIADTSQKPEWKPNGSGGDVGSWLGVPLVAGQRAIGLYALEKEQTGYFTAEHVQLAETLAGQAATAIQNAWLYEQVRAGRERLQVLSHRLVEVQESERQYIAHELHDEAGQSLASLMVKLQLIEQGASHPKVVQDEVAAMEKVLQEVQENLQRLAKALRPASLDHLGLVAALRQHVEGVGATHTLEVNFEAGNLDWQLPDTMQTVLYRVVQEALTNVVRHSQASRVDVLLTQRQEQLSLIIEDDGRGFDLQEAMQKNRLGLQGMQERVEMIDGRLLIESTAGRGTTIAVEIPYEHAYPDR